MFHGGARLRQCCCRSLYGRRERRDESREMTRIGPLLLNVDAMSENVKESALVRRLFARSCNGFGYALHGLGHATWTCRRDVGRFTGREGWRFLLSCHQRAAEHLHLTRVARASQTAANLWPRGGSSPFRRVMPNALGPLTHRGQGLLGRGGAPRKRAKYTEREREGRGGLGEGESARARRE